MDDDLPGSSDDVFAAAHVGPADVAGSTETRDGAVSEGQLSAGG